jgi:glutaredoxin
MRAFAAALLALVALFAGPERAADPDIVMWGHPACPHCRAAHAFLDGLRERRPDLQIVEHDVTQSAEAYEELRARTEQAGLDAVGLPSFVVRGRFEVGFDTAETTGLLIESLLAPAGPPSTVELPVFGRGSPKVPSRPSPINERMSP